MANCPPPVLHVHQMSRAALRDLAESMEHLDVVTITTTSQRLARNAHIAKIMTAEGAAHR